MQKLCNKKGRIVVAAAMLMSLFLELLSPAVTVSAQVADSVNSHNQYHRYFSIKYKYLQK